MTDPRLDPFSSRRRAGLTVLAVTAATLVTVSVVQAQKPSKAPPPVTVTFRCTTTAACLFAGVNDALTDDGLGALPNNAATQSDEGTFITGNGGVSIGLHTGVKTPDRYVTLTLPADTNTSAGACNRTFTTINLTEFVFAGRNGVTANLEAMAVGSAEPGFGGIQFVNPVPDGYIFWTIRFRNGDLTITRPALNEWTYETTGGTVELQCTNSTRKTVTATDGFYAIPFAFRVVK
jgi:hypothetical protein